MPPYAVFKISSSISCVISQTTYITLQFPGYYPAGPPFTPLPDLGSGLLCVSMVTPAGPVALPECSAGNTSIMTNSELETAKRDHTSIYGIESIFITIWNRRESDLEAILVELIHYAPLFELVDSKLTPARRSPRTTMMTVVACIVWC